MIKPNGFPGVCFGEAHDGDARRDEGSRAAFCDALGIPHEWATVNQVHGAVVTDAATSGSLGDADGMITSIPMLPMVIATADCVPIVIAGSSSVAVAHAGWRGVASGVVTQAVRLMRDRGDEPLRAVIGPHIGPCCYEVGPDVVDAIGGYESMTTSGGTSVHLAAAIRDQLHGVHVDIDGACTMHDPRFHSFRENATTERQVTVAWLPQD